MQGSLTRYSRQAKSWQKWIYTSRTRQVNSIMVLDTMYAVKESFDTNLLIIDYNAADVQGRLQ